MVGEGFGNEIDLVDPAPYACLGLWTSHLTKRLFRASLRRFW